jgi:hypothetical protein
MGRSELRWHRRPERIIDPENDIYPPPLMISQDSRKVEGDRRMWMAVWYLCPERVEQLLKEDPSLAELKCEINGDTLLHWASIGITPANLAWNDENNAAYEKIIRTLLNCPNFDVTHRSKFGRTIAQEALRHDNGLMAKIMIECGVWRKSLGSTKCVACFEKPNSSCSLIKSLLCCGHFLCESCQQKIKKKCCPVCKKNFH